MKRSLRPLVLAAALACCSQCYADNYGIVGPPRVVNGVLGFPYSGSQIKLGTPQPGGSFTLLGSVLPAPSSTVFGGILAATAPAHQYQTGNLAGTPLFARPSLIDVLNLTAPGNVNSVVPYVSPQSFNPTAGSGADDAAALQAAINAATGGTLYLPPPSSGSYNICSAGLQIQNAVTILGGGSGQVPIRIQPGCVSPPAQVVYINTYGASTNTKSAGRVKFENVRIDGYGLSTYNIRDDYSVGLSLKNSTLRNVSASHGVNFYETSGYETEIDFSNRIENINDAGNTLYATGSQPDYNVQTFGTDGHFSAVAVNANIANFFQSAGGNNDFSHAHGWGYAVPNSDGQPDLRPQYNFKLLGSATIIGAVADSFTVSGIYVSPAAISYSGSVGNDYSGGQVIGNRCESAVATSGQCIELDNSVHPLKYWVVMGNDTQGIGGSGANPIKIDGAYDGSTSIAMNAWVSGQSSATFGGQLLGLAGLYVGTDSGNGYISATPQSGQTTASLKLSAAGNGVVQATVGTANDTLGPMGKYLTAPFYLGASGNTVLQQSTDAGNAYINAVPPSGSSNSSLKLSAAGGGVVQMIAGGAQFSLGSGGVYSTVPVFAPKSTVGTLPACNAGEEGAITYVTDASSLTFGATPTGGGNIGTTVVCSRSGATPAYAWSMH